MKYIIAVLIALVALPSFAAGSILWTRAGVTRTYESRVEVIDTQISELQSEKETMVLNGYQEAYPFGNDFGAQRDYVRMLDIESEINRLEEEQRILEVAHWLITESFE